MSRFADALVLGAGGLLGGHVMEAFGDAPLGAVVGHRGSRLETPQQVASLLEAHRPAVVVNCIGYLGSDPIEHFRTNGCLPRAMADWCATRSALIQVSTNAVFPASAEREWRPSDPIGPTTPYEVSKAFGEDPRAYVVRATFLGNGGKGRNLLERLRAGQAYKDAPYNGVTAWTLAQRLVALAHQLAGAPRAGLEHVHASHPARLSDVAEFLGSSSRCEGEALNSRLLAGGVPMGTLRSQLADYLAFEKRLVRQRISAQPG